MSTIEFIYKQIERKKNEKQQESSAAKPMVAMEIMAFGEFEIQNVWKLCTLLCVLMLVFFLVYLFLYYFSFWAQYSCRPI